MNQPKRRGLCSPLWLLLIAAACGHSEATNATAPRSARDARDGARVPDTAEHMQASFWMAVIARDALIAGDLEGARRAARELAEHDYGTALPADWKHWVSRMQQHADEVVLAPDVGAAAQALAQVALACGECHAVQRTAHAAQETPPLEWKDPPEDLEARMQRHEIGADQLWLGLIGPSESAWANGTVTLTRAPLEPPSQAGKPVDPLLAARIEELRGLAKRARTARSHPERAQIYGELLSRCASCHYSARPDQAQGSL